MMKIISNTLETSIEEWSDPGDYPNAVAQFPLPSYDYIESVEGEVEVELSEEDLATYQTIKNDADDVQEFIDQTIDPELPPEIASVVWQHEIKDNLLTLWVGEEFEPDPDFDPTPDFE